MCCNQLLFICLIQETVRNLKIYLYLVWCLIYKWNSINKCEINWSFNLYYSYPRLTLILCYGLNYVPLKFIYWSSNPPYFRMWSHWRLCLYKGNQDKMRSLGWALSKKTGVFRKRGKLTIETQIEERWFKDMREKMAVYKPRREARNSSFPHSPLKEPTLPTAVKYNYLCTLVILLL